MFQFFIFAPLIGAILSQEIDNNNTANTELSYDDDDIYEEELEPAASLTFKDLSVSESAIIGAGAGKAGAGKAGFKKGGVAGNFSKISFSLN